MASCVTPDDDTFYPYLTRVIQCVSRARFSLWRARHRLGLPSAGTSGSRGLGPRTSFDKLAPTPQQIYGELPISR